MDITSVIGVPLGIGAVIATALSKQVQLSSLLGLSATIIVGGGTLAAVLIAYPLADVKVAVGSLGMLFKGPGLHPEALISDIEKLAQLARKDGFLALEKEIDKIDDEFLKKGLRMLIDNTDPAVIQETLEAEIAMLYEEEEVGAKFYEDIGAFAPTVGILGAVLGLMVVMQNLNNPDLIGPGIAAAFVATIYGVGIANLFALPAGKKIKRMCHHKKTFREIAATGVLGIAHSHSPKVLVERLKNMSHGH